MQQVIIAITLLFSSVLVAQTKTTSALENGAFVKVSVVNALSDKGEVRFALFNKENFMKQPVAALASTIKEGVSTVVFENVLKGEYAIICFHDENNNKQLDFNENGIPIESFGVSNNVINYGPPQFDTSKFDVENNAVNLEIKF